MLSGQKQLECKHPSKNVIFLRRGSNVPKISPIIEWGLSYVEKKSDLSRTLNLGNLGQMFNVLVLTGHAQKKKMEENLSMSRRHLEGKTSSKPVLS